MAFLLLLDRSLFQQKTAQKKHFIVSLENHQENKVEISSFKNTEMQMRLQNIIKVLSSLQAFKLCWGPLISISLPITNSCVSSDSGLAVKLPKIQYEGLVLLQK